MAGKQYAVTVLTDGCTTVDEMIHLVALNTLSVWVALGMVGEVL